MKSGKTLLIVGVIVLFTAGGWFLLRGGPKDTEETLKIQPAQVQGKFLKGQKAPDVAFVDFEGNTYQLSQFAGKAVVLDFWAGWCPFCIEEMPELQKAQDRHGEVLVMIGVHRTDTEGPSTGLEFAKARGVSYLLISDSNGSLYRAAGGFGMPVAVFIDKEGIVREVKSGPKTEEEIEEKIGRIVN